MNIFRLSVFKILTALMFSPIFSGEALAQQTGTADACISLYNQQTAALTARDWDQLERLAVLYIERCFQVFDKKFNSVALSNLGFSYLYQKNYDDALYVSEKCIEYYYSNANCHVNKVEALIELGRLKDARIKSKIAGKLITHLIEVNERNLKLATTNSAQYEYEAKIKELISINNFLKSMQKHLDP